MREAASHASPSGLFPHEHLSHQRLKSRAHRVELAAVDSPKLNAVEVELLLDRGGVAISRLRRFKVSKRTILNLFCEHLSAFVERQGGPGLSLKQPHRSKSYDLRIGELTRSELPTQGELVSN
jgi:hypothetical protein